MPVEHGIGRMGIAGRLNALSMELDSISGRLRSLELALCMAGIGIPIDRVHAMQEMSASDKQTIY